MARFLSGPARPPIRRSGLRPPPSDEPAWEAGIGPDGRCLFFGDPPGCLIHPVKPAVCRTWPFFRHPLSGEAAFLEASVNCPGLARLDYPSFLASWRLSGVEPLY